MLNAERPPGAGSVHRRGPRPQRPRERGQPESWRGLGVPSVQWEPWSHRFGGLGL